MFEVRLRVNFGETREVIYMPAKKKAKKAKAKKK